MKQCIDPSPSPDCFQMLPSPELLFTREEEEEGGKKPHQNKPPKNQTTKTKQKTNPDPKLWQTLSLLYYKLQPCLGKPQPVLQKVARD